MGLPTPLPHGHGPAPGAVGGGQTGNPHPWTTLPCWSLEACSPQQHCCPGFLSPWSPIPPPA